MKIRTAAASIALLLSATVLAAPPEGLTLDPEISAWFKSVRNPKLKAFGGVCCDQSDGRVLRDDEWRAGSEGYEVRLEGEWRPVPAEAVLDRIDNPTGGAVVFVYRGEILCFVRPNEV